MYGRCPPPPPPPPRYGGGLLQDLLAHGSTDLTQLALRVSALEQQAALQQQNNEIMLRLINALSSPVQSAPSSGVLACAVVTPSEEPDMKVDDASNAIDDLAHNGIRRAAF